MFSKVQGVKSSRYRCIKMSDTLTFLFYLYIVTKGTRPPPPTTGSTNGK